MDNTITNNSSSNSNNIQAIVILLLEQKSCIRDIKFKIYGVSKSIPAAKSQNFVHISRALKPTWAKFLEFNFFYLKRQGYIDIT